ncbi:MAG: GTP 3',8-cyclase MoaA [Bacteroidetes bacterium]|nr:GTP 3',8-cyclase MoaA [Bacteroidota bacterium]
MERKQILDNHGRPINYVRLAVTDRCNLRCFYCMPAEGIKYLPRKELLSYEEMERLLRVLAGLGINKVRITGGEPFLRKDLIGFLENITQIEGIDKVNITTNGVLTAPFIPRLKAMGISSINLSMDTLDRERFAKITRRDELPKVLQCLEALIDSEIPTKINAVIMEGKNTDDIIPLVEYTRNHPVSVRFIEEMPFNGTGEGHSGISWNHRKILETIKNQFPDIEKIPDPPNSTAYNYQIPGFKGEVGIIAAFSRTFCGTCNRIRLTAQGMLKTCLYDDGVMDIRGLIRGGASDEELENAFLQAFGNRAKNGYEAEERRSDQKPSESMSTIGG